MTEARCERCVACSSTTEQARYRVREMMFGTREVFEYVRCAECGSMRIATIPEDLSRHYPENYYSFQQREDLGPRNVIVQMLRLLRDRYALTGRGLAGRVLYSRAPCPELRCLSRAHGLQRNTRILDVGCGTGILLKRLGELGFQRLLGVDQFIASDIQYENGVRVMRGGIESVEGEWDLVMFHHSLEHVPEPLETLRLAASRLATDGEILLRVPVMPSAAWEHYGIHWVGLDAPRHLWVPSVEGLRRLAGRSGLQLRDVGYDSTEFTLWASEQYGRDVPLQDPRSHLVNPRGSGLSKARIRELRLRAAQFNASGRGDQLVAYLARG